MIGDLTAIHVSIFAGASSLAERIAVQFPAISTALERSSLFYAGLVLLVLTLLTSLGARLMTSRFGAQRALAR